jgi:hypothetical protein
MTPLPVARHDPSVRIGPEEECATPPASAAAVSAGFGRIVALHHRSSASHQIDSEKRHLFF